MTGARLAVGAILLAALLSPATGSGAAAAEVDVPAYEKKVRCVDEGAALDPLDDGISAGQRMLGYTSLWHLSTGAGVTVAVIDTGVNPHPALSERLVGGGDLVHPSDGKAGLVDCDGHGTAVAGVIAGAANPQTGFAGVAPDAGILSIRQASERYGPVDTSQGNTAGTTTTLAAAIDLAVEGGASIINISATHCQPAVSTGNPAVADAVTRAMDADVLVVVAAGNLGAGACQTQNPLAGAPVTRAVPADAPEALTVASVTAAAAPSEFTLAGPWVSIAAPGEQVISLNPHPDRTGEVTALVTPDGNVPIQGTSFAAPWVTGVAALVRARFPDLTAAQVKERLITTANHPAGPGGRNNAVGYGVVNPEQALTAVIPDEGEAGRPASDSGGAGGAGGGEPRALPPVLATTDHGARVVALLGTGVLGLVLAGLVLARLSRRSA